MSLIQQIDTDIRTWLASATRIFGNERDMQVELAFWLANSGHYDKVHLEYFVPSEVLKPEYVWDSELRLDIVVEHAGQWVPIELKYKTKAIRSEMERFGEHLEGDFTVIKSHSAQDLGMYDFWKDVRRLELVKKRFSKVVGGIAVFLTNDTYYVKGPKAGTICRNFSMSAGRHPVQKTWFKESSTTKGHPGFMVESEYNLDWEQYTIGQNQFNCLILAVN